MTKKIILLGATGGCADVLDTILDINSHSTEERYDCVGFLDDNAELAGQDILGVPVLGPFSQVADYLEDCFFVTAIGSEKNFMRRSEIIAKLGIPIQRFETVVHPTASISRFASLGRGCVIHQNVTITRDVTIGDLALVLPNTVISHGASIGSFTIINAGVRVAGDVDIKPSCYVGAGSAIRQNVVVNSGSLIGMGSVVLNDVPIDSTVVGNPARVLKR